jgi:hypothetical protein
VSRPSAVARFQAINRLNRTEAKLVLRIPFRFYEVATLTRDAAPQKGDDSAPVLSIVPIALRDRVLRTSRPRSRQ